MIREHQKNKKQELTLSEKRRMLVDEISGREVKMLQRVQQFGDSLMDSTQLSLKNSAKRIAAKTLKPTELIVQKPWLSLAFIFSIGFLGGLWVGKKVKKRSPKIQQAQDFQKAQNETEQNLNVENMASGKFKSKVKPSQFSKTILDGAKQYFMSRAKEIAIGYATDYLLRMLKKYQNKKLVN